jgi:DNA polymerase-3 subunit beta
MIRQIDATNVEIAGVTLTTPAVEDYPAAPKIDPDVGLVGFDEADDMMGHIQRVAACASTDDARPILTVVAFDSFEDHLRVVTTDSYRLAYSDTPVPYSPKHMRARSHPKGPRWEPWIVPVRAFTKTGLVYLSSISFDKTWAVMAGRTKTLDVIMYVGLAEGTYPNYSQLLPENKPDENKPEWKVKAQLTIDAKSLLARLKTLKAIAADHIPIRFTVDAQGDLDVFAIRQDVGQSHGFVPATLEGELEDAVAFNSKYLASVVQAGRTPAKTTGDVVFEIISPLQPAIVTVPGIDGYRALLMPVKCRDRG